MALFKNIFGRNADPPEAAEQRNELTVIDPTAGFIFGGASLSGVAVNEYTAMGLSAVYACVSLISDTIAGLPLRTVNSLPDGSTVRASSWLDEPSGLDGPTAHEFISDMMVSLLLRGNYFAEKVYSKAGVLLYLRAIPSHCVSIDIRQGQKVYRVQMPGGVQDFTDQEILHIPGLSLDGVRGVNPIAIARQSLGGAIGGERAANRMWDTGALMGGIVTPTDGELSSDEMKVANDLLAAATGGERNAGRLVALNKQFSFSQWSINPVDAQFLESRQFATSEIARWYRVPPHMIGDSTNSTSWGSGLQEQTLGFQKFTLQPWTSRIEARLTRLLPEGQKAEFDYKHLLDGTQAESIELLLQQAGGPTMTVNEARRLQNMPPIEGGDKLRAPQAPQSPSEAAA